MYCALLREFDFNSSMVRLKAHCRFTTSAQQFQFQFLNGAIKSYNTCVKLNTDLWFQFLNGAIKRQSIGSTEKVSLLFQFLNGAIKRLSPTFRLISVVPFQFLNGAIKRSMPSFSSNQDFDFNSSMVRLKETVGKYESAIVNAFQFLNGAIKSMFFGVKDSDGIKFQFLNGAIKRRQLTK